MIVRIVPCLTFYCMLPFFTYNFFLSIYKSNQRYYGYIHDIYDFFYP